MGKLIGPKGATIQNIKMKSGALTVRMDKDLEVNFPIPFPCSFFNILTISFLLPILTQSLCPPFSLHAFLNNPYSTTPLLYPLSPTYQEILGVNLRRLNVEGTLTSIRRSLSYSLNSQYIHIYTHTDTNLNLSFTD
ncbi:hypothetical protein EON65_09490 [archaeon]|nr:MAG: hypothetical protein EON65_09490 [archaeon]